jgi:magnesium chelatase family protein
MTPRQVRKFCTPKPEALAILKAAMEDLGLSARAHDKVLRVARTIADLEGQEDIRPQHIAEAVGYRSLDRSVWAYPEPSKATWSAMLKAATPGP